MPLGPGDVRAGHAQVEPLQLGHDILPSKAWSGENPQVQIGIGKMMVEKGFSDLFRCEILAGCFCLSKAMGCPIKWGGKPVNHGKPYKLSLKPIQ